MFAAVAGIGLAAAARMLLAPPVDDDDDDYARGYNALAPHGRSLNSTIRTTARCLHALQLGANPGGVPMNRVRVIVDCPLALAACGQQTGERAEAPPRPSASRSICSIEIGRYGVMLDQVQNLTAERAPARRTRRRRRRRHWRARLRETVWEYNLDALATLRTRAVHRSELRAGLSSRCGSPIHQRGRRRSRKFKLAPTPSARGDAVLGRGLRRCRARATDRSRSAIYVCAME